MTQTQHTPGPWTVHINHPKASYTIFDAKGNYGETDVDTLEANARLIAAAPELLAALEAYRTAVNAGIDADPALYARAALLGDAAIASARGQS